MSYPSTALREHGRRKVSFDTPSSVFPEPDIELVEINIQSGECDHRIRMMLTTLNEVKATLKLVCGFWQFA